MKAAVLVLSAGIFSLFVFSLWHFYYPGKKMGENLVIFLPEPASSLDPINYDLIKNHPAQSVFHLKLISSYAGSMLNLQAAASWRELDEGKEWRFKLRNDLFFSDGKKVSPDVARDSIRRICYLIVSRKSKNEFVSNLKGASNLDGPVGDFDGLFVDGEELVFKFYKPHKKLFETLSFGLYAITHPESYDHISGDWLSADLVKSIGAGPYQIIASTEQNQTFLLKKDYPTDLFHKSAFKKLTFVFENLENNVDIASGTSESEIYRKTHKFIARGAQQIVYFACHPWKQKSSPFHSLEFRRALRELLYKNLENSHFPIVRSFFPLIITGVLEAKDSYSIDNHLDSFGAGAITFDDMRPIKSKMINGALNALVSAIKETGLIAVPKKAIKFEELIKNKNPDLPFYDVDIGFYATGISTEDPEGDIRFMFSQEGIWLPDQNDEIRKILSKETFSIQEVNRRLFDQAIVWPVTHYSVGIWAKDGIDFDNYNTLKPLGELQWIGAK